MSASVIAVRIADGRFAPVLNTETPHRHRRLVLTTVRDNQTQIQIDLYRAQDDSFSDAQYVGSLVLEDIGPELRGEPEIALTLRCDAEGNLVALARDMKKGSYQSLSVNMETLSEEDTYDVAEFELDDFGDMDESEPGFTQHEDNQALSLDEELSGAYESSAAGGPEVAADSPREEPGSVRDDSQRGTGFSPVLYLGFMILALTLVGLLGFLVFRLFEGEPLPPLESERALLWAMPAMLPWRSLTIRCGRKHRL